MQFHIEVSYKFLITKTKPSLPQFRDFKKKLNAIFGPDICLPSIPFLQSLATWVFYILALTA